MDPLERLSSIGQFGMKPGLFRMKWLMEALGFPQMSIPSIHVAGTNGKGSTCAMVDAIMSSFDVRRGLYTSPHLQRLTERMVFDGKEVEEGELRNALDHIFEIIDGKPSKNGEPTYFEILTAAFFHLSSERGSDLNIVEVGMGGRLDATNILEPAACAITSISLDHQEHLGEEEYTIAREKGGIIHPSTPVVIGPLHMEGDEGRRALRGLLEICTFNGCPTILLSSEEGSEEGMEMLRSSGVPDGRLLVVEGSVKDGRTFARISTAPVVEDGPFADVFQLMDTLLPGDFSTPLLGLHQAYNMAASICLSLLSLPSARSHLRLKEGDRGALNDLIDGSHGELLKDPGTERMAELVREGLGRTRIPGRMERLTSKGVEIIYDGGHNSQAAGSLSSTFQLIHPGKKAPMLFTMKSDKDPVSYLANTSKILSSLVITELKEGGMSTVDMARAAASLGDEGFDIHIRPDMDSALALWGRLTEEDSIGIAGGSFYLYEPLMKWLRRPR